MTIKPLPHEREIPGGGGGQKRFDDYRSLKITCMDLATITTVRFMPIVFTLPTSWVHIWFNTVCPTGICLLCGRGSGNIRPHWTQNPLAFKQASKSSYHTAHSQSLHLICLQALLMKRVNLNSVRYRILLYHCFGRFSSLLWYVCAIKLSSLMI